MSGSSTLFLVTGSLTDPKVHCFGQASWLVNKLLVSTHLCPQTLKGQAHRGMAFTWVMESQIQVLSLAWQASCPLSHLPVLDLLQWKKQYFKKNKSWPKDKTISTWQSQNLALTLSASRALQPLPTTVLRKSPIFISGALSSKEEFLCRGHVFFHKTNHCD